jgi:HAD superfamily hydrolase (TIGR01490 family)
MTAAFFDLDGTLLRANTASLWIRRERRHGRARKRDLVRAAAMLTGYWFGFLDMEAALRSALRSLRGVDEEDIREQTRAWWDEDVRPHVARGARERVEQHRIRGDRLVLLTSSSLYASEMALNEFGLEVALCQRYEVRDRKFTGEPVKPLCYGPGKVELAEAWAQEHRIELARSSFYSDSSTDVPMLERVGSPYVVNPDPRLRLIARRRGWPVLDWS